MDISIGFSDLHFDTVAVYLSILESHNSKYADSVVYGNLIVTSHDMHILAFIAGIPLLYYLLF